MFAGQENQKRLFIKAHPSINSLAEKQQGAILPLVAVASLMLLTMVGMGVDFARIYGIRDSLHQAVDAAALAAAKTLSRSDSTVDQAKTDAQAAYNAYALGTGNSAIQNLAVSTVFSQKMSPFVAVSTKAPFVKVSASMKVDYWLLKVAGMTQATLNAESAAGPSMVEICGNLPIVACADPNQSPNFGYTATTVYDLLVDNNKNLIGPGNFGLINIGTKKNDWVQWTSGALNTCATINIDTPIQTITGANVGPLSKCLNARFVNNSGCNEKAGVTTPPRDINTCEDYTQNSMTPTKTYPYASYITNAACTTGLGSTNNASPSKAKRRLVKIIMMKCSGTTNGTDVVQPIGSGCFFMRSQSDGKRLRAEYMGPCPAGFDDGDSNKITLYKSN